MTSTIIPTPPITESPQNHIPHVILIWRQKQLLVKRSLEYKQPYLPALENNQRLVECLKNSPVRLVRVEPELGEANLKFWADASEQANKQVFLRLPTMGTVLKKQGSWWVTRALNSVTAAVLLMLLSPVMLALGLLIRLYSPGPIFYRQWHVGERGKLFRVLKFRTTFINAGTLHQRMMLNQHLYKREGATQVTPIGSWMRKYKLEMLPQLFNVLRGEMSLIGPRPWTLYDAVRLGPEAQKRLNVRPGVIGASSVEAGFKPANSGAIQTL